MWGRVHVGGGFVAGPVTWFPVWLETPPPAREVSCGAEAPLVVRERDEQTVEWLTVLAWHGPVWLLHGELVVGGWQDRVVAGSILVERREATAVPVRCVERQRWDGAHVAARAGRLAPPSVRAALLGDEQVQSRVWSAVAERRHARGLANPAGSVREAIDSADAGGVRPPLMGQRGIVVGVGGRIVALEAFASDTHYAAWHAALVGAAAVDAPAGPAVGCSARSARTFARRVSALHATCQPAAAGRGRQLFAATEGMLVTGACDADGAPAHVVALAA